MRVKEAIELIDSYIDPVDNDVIEAVSIVKAEIGRKDIEIRRAMSNIRAGHVGLAVKSLEQALQNKEENNGKRKTDR